MDAMRTGASPVQRSVDWPGCQNVRDLGGLPVGAGQTRWGRLYRSDSLFRLTAAGRAAVRAAGVSLVVDLREGPLQEAQPHPFRAAGTGPRVVALPLVPPGFPFPIPLEGGYCALLGAAAAADRVRPIVRAIAEESGPIVFHCHSGAGRTGTLAAVLLAAVGVTAEAIAEDFLASMSAEHFAADQIGLAANVAPQLLDHLDTAYGGAVAYLRSAGVADADLDRLRRRLVPW
ncbi:MAG TPA: tyrosine-protein phosphatase [Rugosimonospora sp.]|nr:tyrosine-protein phosphatase [Rugosimonospora sp.]